MAYLGCRFYMVYQYFSQHIINTSHFFPFISTAPKVIYPVDLAPFWPPYGGFPSQYPESSSIDGFLHEIIQLLPAIGVPTYLWYGHGMEYSPMINPWFTILLTIYSPLYINHISTIVNPWLSIILILHFGRPRILPEPALAPSRVPGTPTRTSRSGSDAAPPRRQAEAEKGGTNSELIFLWG